MQRLLFINTYAKEIQNGDIHKGRTTKAQRHKQTQKLLEALVTSAKEEPQRQKDTKKHKRILNELMRSTKVEPQRQKETQKDFVRVDEKH